MRGIGYGGLGMGLAAAAASLAIAIVPTRIRLNDPAGGYPENFLEFRSKPYASRVRNHGQPREYCSTGNKRQRRRRRSA